MRKFLSLLLALVMVLCCIPAMAETADGVYEGTGAGLNGQIKVSVMWINCRKYLMKACMILPTNRILPILIYSVTSKEKNGVPRNR